MKTNISLQLSGLAGILTILLMSPMAKAELLTNVSYERQVGLQIDRRVSGASDVSSVFSGTALPATGSIFTDGPAPGAFASGDYNFAYDGTQASFQGTTTFNMIGGFSSYTEGLSYSGADNSSQGQEPNFFTLNQSATYSIQTSGSATYNTSFPLGSMYFQIWKVNATSPTANVYGEWIRGAEGTATIGTTSAVKGVLDPGNYYFIEMNYGSLASGNLTRIGDANLAGTTSFIFDIKAVAVAPEPASLFLLSTVGCVVVARRGIRTLKPKRGRRSFRTTR